MKNFLKKIGLIDALTTELVIDRRTFIHRLKENVDHSSNGIFSTFNSSKKEYRGTVGYDNFEISRREFYAQQNQMQAKANGKIYERGGKLIVESEISGYTPWLFVFLIFIVVFYCIFLGTFFYGGFGAESGFPFFVIPFFLFHGCFMVLVPYKALKRSVEKLKHDLEREFFYLAR